MQGPTSYADTLQESEHGHPAVFLRNGAPHRSRVASSTALHIVDCLESEVVSSKVTVPSHGEIQQDLFRQLEEVPRASRCRFVLWQLSGNWSINNAYLDYIALKYELDPYFLSAHLAQGRRASFRSVEPFSQALATRRKHIQLIAGCDTSLALTLAAEGSLQPVGMSSPELLNGRTLQKLVVAFGQDVYSPERTSRLAKLIADLDPLALTELVGNPMDVALMYLTELVKDASIDAMHCLITTSVGNVVLPDLLIDQSELQRIHWTLQAWYTSLQIGRQNLLTFQRYASPKNKLSDKRLAATIDEVDIMKAELNTQLQSQQHILESIASGVQTQQAKHSSSEAATTRRLAVIACIFLPLNFATSFLGMNLKQFNGGQIGMGWFFSVLALAGLLSVITISVNPSIETAWSQARAQAAEYAGWYEEEDYNNVSSVRVAQTYAQNIMVVGKRWWILNVLPKLPRARRWDHPV